MSKEELEKSESARKFIKDNEELLISKFCNRTDYPPDDNPVSLFMAGRQVQEKLNFQKT